MSLSSLTPNHNELATNSRYQEQAFQDAFNCNWILDPNKWDKTQFIRDISRFIEQSQGINAYPNSVLILMLTHQIDIYVECCQMLAKTNLIESYNKGTTSGPSIYFSIADKSLNRVMQIMKELGVTPSHRIGSVKQNTAETIEFDLFMLGH